MRACVALESKHAAQCCLCGGLAFPVKPPPLTLQLNIYKFPVRQNMERDAASGKQIRALCKN